MNHHESSKLGHTTECHDLDRQSELELSLFCWPPDFRMQFLSDNNVWQVHKKKLPYLPYYNFFNKMYI